MNVDGKARARRSESMCLAHAHPQEYTTHNSGRDEHFRVVVLFVCLLMSMRTGSLFTYPLMYEIYRAR